MSTRNTGCDDPSRPRPPHHFHFPPVQLSPPTLNPWPVSPLTTTDVNYTPIMYTSSANFFKALTGTTGEPNYTLQTPVMSPPQQLPGHVLDAQTQLLHLQSTLYKQLVLRWLSGFLCVVQYDRVIVSVEEAKQFLHVHGPPMSSVSDMKK